jgi:hypothetical protein
MMMTCGERSSEWAESVAESYGERGGGRGAWR